MYSSIRSTDGGKNGPAANGTRCNATYSRRLYRMVRGRKINSHSYSARRKGTFSKPVLHGFYRYHEHRRYASMLRKVKKYMMNPSGRKGSSSA
jgi:hypothetical protein